MAHQHVASRYMEHGVCFDWEPGLVWLHVGADIITGISYFSIPVAMFYFAYKRRDLPFLSLFLLFATFILSCGTTHFFAAYTVFVPEYWPEGFVKAFTASISAFAAVLLIPRLPEALALPSLNSSLHEIKQLNTELKRKNVEQARHIAERQKAAHERELLINQLQDKTSELERFIYTVSHDLKSPLITISGFLGFLMEDYKKQDEAQFTSTISRISQASERMKQLLDELLELSRVGRKMNPVEKVSLTLLVREAVELISGRIEEFGAVVEIDPDLPEAMVDRHRILQVYENLIDNAVKFSSGREEPPRVVAGVRRNEEGEQVLFVADNGIGIETHYTNRVFDLFEKLDPRSSGTGVGLAIVKRAIEVHGGKIWAESAGIGRGTTFCFTLPLVNS